MKSRAFIRTTVDIPAPLYKELRERAAKEGTTIKALLVEGADRVLRPKMAAPRRRITEAIVKSKRPGTLDITNEQIYELGFP